MIETIPNLGQKLKLGYGGNEKEKSRSARKISLNQCCKEMETLHINKRKEKRKKEYGIQVQMKFGFPSNASSEKIG